MLDGVRSMMTQEEIRVGMRGLGEAKKGMRGQEGV